MNRWTWKTCCEQTVVDLNILGISTTTSAEVVARWYRDFRDRGNLFADPNPTGRVLHPKLFEHYPDAKESFCDFADANMKMLTGELMLGYVVDILIPALRKEHNSANPQQEDVADDKEFLLSMGYRNLGVATVVKWMNALGYRYNVRCKHYFNDRNEEPTNVTYRGGYLG